MLCTSDEFSQYTIVKRLGGGTFGEVFLVDTHNKQYVLKSIRINNIEDALIEINNLKLLQGVSNILQLYGVCYENIKQQISIFCESMNDNLWNWHIKQNKQTIEREVPQILGQIATALDYLHQLNIGHFDLKPQNILVKLTPLGMIYKLADFGTSSLNYRMDSLSFDVGTYMYQAPEVLLGISTKSKSDIWSLGLSVLVLLYSGYLWPIDKNKDITEVCNNSTVYPENKNIDCSEYIKRYKDNTIEGNLYIPRSMPYRSLLQQMMQLNPADRATPQDIEEHLGKNPQNIHINDVYSTETKVNLENLNQAWKYIRKQKANPGTDKHSFSINNVQDIITIELISRYSGNLDIYTTTVFMSYIAESYVNSGYSDASNYSSQLNITTDEFYTYIFQILKDIDYRIYNPHLHTAIQNIANISTKYVDNFNLYNWYYTFVNSKFDLWFTESYDEVLQYMQIYPQIEWKSVSTYNPPYTNKQWHQIIRTLINSCKQNNVISLRNQIWIIYIFRKYLQENYITDINIVMISAIYTYKRTNIGFSLYYEDLPISNVMLSYPYFNTIVDYIHFDTRHQNHTKVYEYAKKVALAIYAYDTYYNYPDSELATVCIDIAYFSYTKSKPILDNESKLFSLIYNDSNIIKQ